eukprot:CAMPEP_0182898338 /NCGR_PEP_ID=MMETSP0034_2-20130328/27421_1 /TAXON_ID=156128 /ORGANISM="Nephroselmis pyriformis, Strain CCMP717" /LENGTH=205 /DNA_ID=CAMNT_0025032301 /DNA_START=138 /DNA_END=752 /DNA_ORIENTATION=+
MTKVEPAEYGETEAYSKEMELIKKEAMSSPRSFMLLAALGTPPSELRDRLVNEATNLGVVTALMSGVVLAQLADPIEASRAVVDFYLIVNSMSLFLNLGCVALSTLMITSMNLLNDETTLPYIRKHATFFTLVLFQFFTISIVLLTVGACMWIHYKFDSDIVTIISSVTAAGVLILVGLTYYIIDCARMDSLKDMLKREMALEKW